MVVRFSSFALHISILSDVKLYLDFSVLPCFVQLINYLINQKLFHRLYLTAYPSDVFICIFVFWYNKRLEVCAYHSVPLCNGAPSPLHSLYQTSYPHFSRCCHNSFCIIHFSNPPSFPRKKPKVSFL